MNSFIKDTNHFLREIKILCQLPELAIVCTVAAVCRYPNILHEESLASLRRFLDGKTEKKVTIETLVELAEIVLKNNIIQLSKTLKQFSGKATGIKFSLSCAILFMGDLDERISVDIATTHMVKVY